jgi:hypothetical protein
MSTLGAVLLAGTTGLLTATLMMDWMVVDVHVTEDVQAPIHIKFPFPLIIADVAASFIPDEVFEEAEIPPEVKAQKKLVLATLEALLDSPDTHFVSVTSPDANVDIFKDGETLRILVDAEGAKVACNVPIDGIYKALNDWDWETVNAQMAFDILHAAENGDLVNVVTDDGVRVAIKMW